MIDFNTYEKVKLEDVAEYERAKKGQIYPAGTSTIQISATRGQLGYLDKPGEIETKYVAIIPKAGINPKYFNVVMQKNIEKFMFKYCSGLNIIEKDVGKFPIYLHNKETQDTIAKLFGYVEEQERIEQAEISNLKNLKSNSLDSMFA
ncbi:restriction endonuclease subunit S [Ligilactobacillus ruminis]|uniref:restriction endonuclease subunit S n=1 Tax=Ligilactobacillus ruminis TaxID=1623 RepID=UPI00232CE677|nr:restriction endonuclease subunit S [Ligilactobacillus ruminis]MDB7636333.1 restriction endonuclease subunit S [Ligilactobacillus ruminis]MDB7679429.1 restriction endonuclease subunit S [Ligilactobacillus ruminis]